MGQKINPLIFRISNSKDKVWSSSWYEHKKLNYSKLICNDLMLSSSILESKNISGLSGVSIERKSGQVFLNIKTAKTSSIFSKKSNSLESIALKLKKINQSVSINVSEIRNSDLDAKIVASSICAQISKRMSYKKVIKMAIKNSIKAGALGVKVSCSGRLNGADIARSEKFHEGSMPLHKISAGIDYAISEAKTIYGIIGVKVWIYTKYKNMKK